MIDLGLDLAEGCAGLIGLFVRAAVIGAGVGAGVWLALAVGRATGSLP